MPSGVNAGNQFTRRPGVTATLGTDSNAGTVADAKRLCVVGDFPFLEQHTPTLYTSQKSMLKAAPFSAYLRRAASQIYKASRDGRVGRPSEIVLVNAGENTQAAVTLDDGAAADTITIKSKSWGYAGNRTSYALTISGTRYTFTFVRDGQTETIVVDGVALFSVQYTGNDSFTCLAGFNSSDEFFITASKAAIAIGTFSPACTWDGVVTIDPTIGPSGGTYTALITGTNKVTGATGDTETITWTDGGGHAPQSSTKQFSLITSIAFANNSGGGSPTFTVSGDMVRVTATQYPSILLLTNYLASKTSDLTVTAVTGFASTMLVEDMDISAASSIATAKTFSNVKARIIDAFDTAAMVEAIDAGASAGAPVAASGYLSGGTESAAASGDWAGACASVSAIWRCSIFALLTNDATGRLAFASFLETTWGVGRYESQGFVGIGGLTGDTKANVKSLILALNSFKVVPAIQPTKITLVNGFQEKVEPFWTALGLAAMQAGVAFAVPLTWKFPDVVEVYDGPDWTIADDLEELLSYAATVITPGENGLQIERALTSWLQDDNDSLTAPSAVEGIARYIRRMRSRLNTCIGDPAVPTTQGRIESLVDTETSACVRDRDGISAYDPNSISVEQEGGKWVIGIGIAAINEITQIVFFPNLITI